MTCKDNVLVNFEAIGTIACYVLRDSHNDAMTSTKERNLNHAHAHTSISIHTHIVRYYSFLPPKFRHSELFNETSWRF